MPVYYLYILNQQEWIVGAELTLRSVTFYTPEHTNIIYTSTWFSAHVIAKHAHQATNQHLQPLGVIGPPRWLVITHSTLLNFTLSRIISSSFPQCSGELQSQSCTEDSRPAVWQQEAGAALRSFNGFPTVTFLQNNFLIMTASTVFYAKVWVTFLCFLQEWAEEEEWENIFCARQNQIMSSVKYTSAFWGMRILVFNFSLLCASIKFLHWEIGFPVFLLFVRN